MVIHDRLVSPEILELARREALMIDAGKEGFGPSMAQADINALIVEHARERRAGGAAEIRRPDRLRPAGRGDRGRDRRRGSSWHIVPGITAASAAVAAIGQSLTEARPQRLGAVPDRARHEGLRRSRLAALARPARSRRSTWARGPRASSGPADDARRRSRDAGHRGRERLAPRQRDPRDDAVDACPPIWPRPS